MSLLTNSQTIIVNLADIVVVAVVVIDRDIEIVEP